MINAKINGQPTDLMENTTLQQYLEAKDCKIDRVAIELNGQIVPKKAYSTQVINTGDTLEIVSFVGGG